LAAHCEASDAAAEDFCFRGNENAVRKNILNDWPIRHSILALPTEIN
jgi:hypothetical protein